LFASYCPILILKDLRCSVSERAMGKRVEITSWEKHRLNFSSQCPDWQCPKLASYLIDTYSKAGLALN